MQLLLTAGQMAAFDRETIDKIKVPGVVLMENAGVGVVKVIKDLLGSVEHKKIDIFCGKGNNGGDGHVVARHLANMGAEVCVYLIGKIADVKGDAAINLHIIQKMNVKIVEVSDIKQIEADNTVQRRTNLM